MQSLNKVTIARPRLADQVYEQILSALQSGDLDASERLHQERIAERLDVSRTPVREALMRLEREGIILPAKNGGFELRKIQREDVASIYEARVAIEGYAVGFLAESKDKAFISSLRQKIVALENQTPESNEEYYLTNRSIHKAFIEPANNENLTRMFDELWNRNLSMQIFGTLQADHLDQTLVGHIELCDALVEGKFYKAYDAMKQHIENGLDLQLAALDN